MRTRSGRVTGGNVSLADLTRRILFVHHRSELGGAPTSLSLLIRNLDRDRFEPHVYLPVRCRGGAVSGVRRDRSRRDRGELHPHLGQHVSRPPLAPLRARARTTAGARRRVRTSAARGSLRPRASERLAADPRRLALAPRRQARRLAPAFGAALRGTGSPVTPRTEGVPAVRQRARRDQRRRRTALGRPGGRDPERSRPRAVSSRRLRCGARRRPACRSIVPSSPTSASSTRSKGFREFVPRHR